VNKITKGKTDTSKIKAATKKEAVKDKQLENEEEAKPIKPKGTSGRKKSVEAAPKEDK